MNRILGCFGTIIVIILGLMLIQWIFQNIIGFLGLAVAIWGIVEWNKNRKLGAKSKVPGILVAIGLLISIGGFIGGSSTEEASTNSLKEEIQDNAQEISDETSEKADKEDTENSDDESTNELATTTPTPTESNLTDQQSVNNENKEEQNASAAALGLAIATVSRVVDGDTVELSDGSRLRLIGVNTPESTTRTEPYGKEASNYTKSKLEGKQVYLQKDVSDTDRYGRLLRLVWMDVPTDLMNENEIRTKMFNADLVLNGYAQASTYNPDVTYAEYFRKFEREARENNTGLWAIDPDGTTKGDYNSTSSSGSTSNNSNNNATSNANQGSSSNNSTPSSNTTTSGDPSSGYYVIPGAPTNFKNCDAMREYYPNGVHQSHPAYAPARDRDKDGWACER